MRVSFVISQGHRHLYGMIANLKMDSGAVNQQEMLDRIAATEIGQPFLLKLFCFCLFLSLN